MKKTTKTIILCILLFLSLATVFAVAALAEEREKGNATPAAAISEEYVEETGFFGEAYKAIRDNSEKIFSLLAFIGTLIIAFVYKKGLLPKVKNAVAAINEAMKKITEENERFSSEVKKNSSGVTSCENAVKNLSEELSRLSKALEKAQGGKEREVFKSLLDTQIELLRDIFISSSLPHYQKEAVEAKVKEMKEALKKNESENT